MAGLNTTGVGFLADLPALVKPDSMTEASAVETQILRDYPALIMALRDRRMELGLSCLDVETATGIQFGYVAKIENWERGYGRALGPVVLPRLLSGLSAGLILVDDGTIESRVSKLYEGRRAA